MQGLLRTGSFGNDVEALQSALNAQNTSMYPDLAVDGQFGPITNSRVTEFQRRNGLSADGIVGPVTLRALGPWLEPCNKPVDDFSQIF